jgi:thiol-disulfide isomerase/thioredoxin
MNAKPSLSARWRRLPRWVRWPLELGLLAALVLGISAWRAAGVPAGEAPPFQARLADGGAVSLSDWRDRHPGRATALYFWAEWCPVCKLQEGSVEALRGDWPLLTVALQSGDAVAVRRHLHARGIGWDTAVDEKGALAAQYGVRGVPALIVIGPDGRIRFAEIGYTSEIGMRARLWWAERVAR